MNLFSDFTRILMHDSECCHSAREWFLMMDKVFCKVENSPFHLSWLYDTYSWGPNKYPIYWCALMKTKTIDCGVFADLVQTLLQQRGVECSRIQQYSLERESQKEYWKEKWKSAGVEYKNWIVDNTFIYHEFLAINIDGEAVFFDTSTGKIVDDRSPFVSPVVYMRMCQHMSIPVSYNQIILKAKDWIAMTN